MRYRLLLTPIAALAQLAACVYEPGQRCGPDQSFVGGFCACREGTRFDRGACLPVPDAAMASPDAGAPLGQGRPCATAVDCQGTEATWCEFTTLKACVVEGCAVENPGSCDVGWRCCDVSHLGLAKTLCLPVEACP